MKCRNFFFNEKDRLILKNVNFRSLKIFDLLIHHCLEKERPISSLPYSCTRIASSSLPEIVLLFSQPFPVLTLHSISDKLIPLSPVVLESAAH